jgi:16S rRNA (cytosine967-C5)-methyltransferase
VRISAYDLASEVIRSASPERPADAALREVLKSTRNLPPFVAREASNLVFAHYRWRGWTEHERHLLGKLRLASRLNDRFCSDSRSFPLAELRAHAIPSWVSQEMDISDEWLTLLQSEPQLWLRAKKGHGNELAGKLGHCTPGPLPDALIYEGDADLFRTPEFHSGEFEIQDVSSQAVSWLCEPKSGETWWDACAGEGGKLLHLSDLMGNKGLIWASDRALWRLAKLKRRTARAQAFNYRAAPWDGGPKLPGKTKFDGVLVDAPCSGLGTWHRNPHARWTTTPQDIHELAEIQKLLLKHVAPAIKLGGKLVYSVCTLTRKETEDVAVAFSEAHPAFQRQPLPGPENKNRALASAASMIRNKMFVAVWRRTA